MMKRFKKTMDQGKQYEALISDLSKAFDCFAQDLITTDLDGHGFSIKSLELLNDYLTEHKS